jgi:hypothetical protein
MAACSVWPARLGQAHDVVVNSGDRKTGKSVMRITFARRGAHHLALSSTRKERLVMSTTITVPRTAGIAFKAEESRRAGPMRRAFAALMESRQRSAGRRIASYLDGLSDARLADLGWTAAEIQALRARAMQS